MKHFKLIIGFVVVLLTFSITNIVAQEQIKVMSYNIRLDVAADGENRWDLRKEKVTALMQYYAPDFIGSQEVQHHQLQYILTQLYNYKYIGVGRDDGKTGGEYSCIFYNYKKVELIQQATFWLSPRPDTVSMGWDAAYRRVCTYGLFKIKKSGQLLWVFNTHLDNEGATARWKGIQLITTTIAAVNKGKNYPVILSGDFNALPADAPVLHAESVLNYARKLSKEKPYGPADTWEGFEFNKKPDGCIDYIFVSKDKKWTVEKFATITDSYDMKYPSDHFPVLATLALKK
jgi:endonuclease/exonuclease/phosphatase family metal-dependent hydrolase